jgi:phosphohistidine phosphatase
MRLYFVRHGKAEAGSGNDHDRQLTPAGAARLETEARVIQKLGIRPQVIYSSPRVRALQTAQIIAQVLDAPVEVRDEVNFDFNLSAVAALTADLSPEAEVMFVGHNPSMAQVVQGITGANVVLKTGSVARVDIDLPGRDLRGQLVWLLAPKVFDLLG